MTGSSAWRWGGGTSIVLAALLSTSSAQAQAAPAAPYSPGPQSQSPFAPPPPPNPGVQREGILAGVSMGFGSINVSDTSHSTFNYQLQFGGFLSNQWALAVELWGASHSDDTYSLGNSNAGIVMQYWLSDSFWLKGGLGSATLEESIDDQVIATYEGAAVAAGVGWDFYQRGDYHFNANFLMSIEGYEDTRDNVTVSALQIGMQYY